MKIETFFACHILVGDAEDSVYRA